MVRLPDELVVAVGLSREIARVAKGALSSAHSRWGKLESQVRHRTDAGARHRIVTHAKPDGDAIVSAWLAMRYLFVGEAVEMYSSFRDVASWAAYGRATAL